MEIQKGPPQQTNISIKGYFHSTTSMQTFLSGFLRPKQKRALAGLFSGGLPTGRRGGGLFRCRGGRGRRGERFKEEKEGRRVSGRGERRDRV